MYTDYRVRIFVRKFTFPVKLVRTMTWFGTNLTDDSPPNFDHCINCKGL